MFEEELEHLSESADLAEWVLAKTQEWRDDYDTNYDDDHREYYRLWRSKWAEEDKTRDSERSRLVAPALQQAVESNVAEIEEASFSRGVIFDIEDDVAGQNPEEVQFLRNKLTEDFEIAKIRSSVGECLINSAVYGTGIAEIIIEEKRVYTPATEPMMEGSLLAVGVNETVRPIVRLNPTQPHNFLIDPNATCIDDAMGCAIDEFVGLHSIELLQEQGVYKDAYVGTAAYDEEIEADRETTGDQTDRVRLLKYYGLVPREMLEEEGVDVKAKSMYVEAIVVIANEGTLLKAIENPYMCQDRPVIAFSWDVVPSRFWGRGVCEKGYMSQKALDAELRARIDALALTTHPMMGVDSTRVPRGTKFEVRPGKMFLTQGPPADILEPFNFGQVDQITFAQAAALQQMVQSATGAVDSAGLAGSINGDAAVGAMSMSLGAIMKRQKRTLVNFQENFLMEFVRKAAWRYMQFDSENYPVADYKFRVISSLGVIAREYEVGQLTQVLQTMEAGSPAHAEVLNSILEHLNITNREEIAKKLAEGSQPNPEEQAAAQKQKEMEIAVLEAQIKLLNEQGNEAASRAAKNSIETQMYPTETALKYADSNNDGKMDRDFAQRMGMAELMLRQREMAVKEKQASDTSKEDAEKQLIEQLTAGVTGNGQNQA